MLTASTHILHTSARAHYWEGVGALSIKLFPRGQARYQSGSAAYCVDQHCYLLLNQGQPYSVTVDWPSPVESFCIFFGADMLHDAWHAHRRDAAALLDTPCAPAAVPVFVDRTYPHDMLLSPALLALYRGFSAGLHEAAWLDEQCTALLGRMLILHSHVQAEIAALPAARVATRVELYRRLHHARDYAAAYLHLPLTLADLARVAHLSPTHLLRSFKALFGQSPYQYLTELRLARACELLRTSALPVSTICQELGFSSLGSFSWLFRRRVGVAPMAYRHTHQQETPRR